MCRSTPSSSRSREVSLVRTSAVTHAVDTDQRRIPLTATATDGVDYRMQIPGDRGAVLPGYYLLLAMAADGTPSVATFIHIR
jgi:galactose oxidase